MVLYLTINPVDYVCGPLTWYTKYILWMDDIWIPSHKISKISYIGYDKVFEDDCVP